MAKFNLDKSSGRQFDLSKGGKRKFDLSKDDDEPYVSESSPTAVPASAMTNEKESTSANGKKWSLIIVALACAGALAWWLIPSSSTSGSDVATEIPAEGVVSSESEVATAESPVVETPAETSASQSAVEPAANDEQIPPSVSNSVVETPGAIESVSGNLEEEALKVIRGEYGVGKERMSKLGDKYSAIQTRVNQLKREGAF